MTALAVWQYAGSVGVLEGAEAVGSTDEAVLNTLHVAALLEVDDALDVVSLQDGAVVVVSFLQNKQLAAKFLKLRQSLESIFIGGRLLFDRGQESRILTEQVEISHEFGVLPEDQCDDRGCVYLHFKIDNFNYNNKSLDIIERDILSVQHIN